MKNFPFEYEGQTYWWSRSCAVSMYVFASDEFGQWYVLANRRGAGCPDFNGYWNCPCGYLDCDETGEQAARRECYEETGLQINLNDIKFDSVNTSPTCNRQNVTLCYYTVLPGNVNYYSKYLNTSHMESNEVDGLKFVPVADVMNIEYKWAFGHDERITYLFNKYVNVNWFTKIIRKFFAKHLN